MQRREVWGLRTTANFGIFAYDFDMEAQKPRRFADSTAMGLR